MASGQGHTAGTELLRAGRLLVANPLLPDPNFDRTVVLLIAFASGEGAVGVVLNRPSDQEVSAPLPAWRDVASEPAVLFVGGPVQRQAVICLARGAVDAGPEGHDGWEPVTPEIGTLELGGDPSALAARFGPVRLFAGYAGWGAGQLEGEVDSGAWWVVDADPDDPFTRRPGDLWRQVLLRQPGRLPLVAYFPDDPAWN